MLASTDVTFALQQGDSDDSGAVDMADFVDALNSNGAPADASNLRRDITSDGNINVFDFAQIKNNDGNALP